MWFSIIEKKTKQNEEQEKEERTAFHCLKKQGKDTKRGKNETAKTSLFNSLFAGIFWCWFLCFFFDWREELCDACSLSVDKKEREKNEKCEEFDV